MSDDKAKSGGQDRSRINVNQTYELRDWSKKFGGLTRTSSRLPSRRSETLPMPSRVISRASESHRTGPVSQQLEGRRSPALRRAAGAGPNSPWDARFEFVQIHLHTCRFDLAHPAAYGVAWAPLLRWDSVGWDLAHSSRGSSTAAR